MFDLLNFDFDLNEDFGLIDYLLTDTPELPPEEERHFIPIESDVDFEGKKDPR